MGQSELLLLESSIGCGHESVREFGFLGKGAAQQDVSDSATSCGMTLASAKTQ